MEKHDIDIELPPLPEARIVSYQTDSTMRRMELRTHSDEDMKAYATAAIEADRKKFGRNDNDHMNDNDHCKRRGSIVNNASASSESVAKIDPNPPQLSIVWHDSPESIYRAMWEQAAIEAGVSYEELIEGSNVGETEDGEVFEFTHEQAIEGMRTQGCWGFVDTKTNVINAWAEDDVNAATVIHFLAHEIGHMTGDQHDDDMQEEMRAEQFGRVAALAYTLWLERKSSAPQPAERSRGEPVLVGWAVGTTGGGLLHASKYAEHEARDAGYSLPLYRLAPQQPLSESDIPAEPTPSQIRRARLRADPVKAAALDRAKERIAAELANSADPVKGPSDSAIMFEWSQTPNTGDMRVDLIAFARALLARYGQYT